MLDRERAPFHRALVPDRFFRRAVPHKPTPRAWLDRLLNFLPPIGDLCSLPARPRDVRSLLRTARPARGPGRRPRHLSTPGTESILEQKKMRGLPAITGETHPAGAEYDGR